MANTKRETEVQQLIADHREWIVQERGDLVADQLDRIGQRRLQLKEAEEQLRKDTFFAIRAAMREKIPVAQIARRIGLNRSTIYELYYAKKNRYGETNKVGRK